MDRKPRVEDVEAAMMQRYMRKFADEDGVLHYPHLDEFGREWVDPTPMAPPVGYKPPLSMVDIVREQIRVHMSQVARANEMETFEDADDFDVEDDDYDPTSPYEYNFDPPAPSEPAQPPVSVTAPPVADPPAAGPTASAAAPASAVEPGPAPARSS